MGDIFAEQFWGDIFADLRHTAKLLLTSLPLPFILALKQFHVSSLSIQS
jgi:hypothetical protein